MLVKKASDKWIICVDYTNLNKACLKVTHPLPIIDKLVDTSVEYKLLLYMDAYTDYNPKLMYELERGNITFIIEQTNYQYNRMPFDLKMQEKCTRE